MILDTTAIIDFLRGEPKIIEKIKNLEEKNVPIYLTSISVFEIWQGVKDLLDEKKREKINNLLEATANFSLDISSSKEAGSNPGLLKKEGIIIDPEDSMIAGIAKINREKILTRNIKHFQRINGIMIETY